METTTYKGAERTLSVSLDGSIIETIEYPDGNFRVAMTPEQAEAKAAALLKAAKLARAAASGE